MKKNLLFLVFTFLILASTYTSFAQLVGTQIFLQGSYLEIGIAANGAFGTTNSPAGYHPRPSSFGAGTSATSLAEVYDWGHDGWAVGNPAYQGDYTMPGTPDEGWSIQVGTANNTNGNAWQATGPGYTGGLTGAVTTYSNLAGVIKGNWAGSFSGLTINQETRVDQFASWVVVTTTFTNNTAAPIANVFYGRTCDPDNDAALSGIYNTKNSITYQNDADHRVEVSTLGTSYAAAADYMGLCTKDCRAKAWWTNTGLTPATNNLATIYNSSPTGTYYQVLHSGYNSDVAIGMVWSLGTIAAGANTTISYAYAFTDSVHGIDSAFPEPLLIVNNIAVSPAGPAPDSTVDTFNTCLYPGMTSLPVNINFASDKVWTGSTWTWSPATGLASTTGVNNTINITGLPTSITYTITGTNAAYCAARTMYLTVLTCNGATVNTPCLGDTLKFNAPGDSTNATYSWYGPAPSTTVVATTQSFFKYPSVWADTGLYHVVKTVGIIHDTSSASAMLNPLPVLSAGGILCNGGTKPLTATPPGGIWASSNPGIASVDPTGVVTGESPGATQIIFTIAATGCRDSTSISIVNLTPIVGDTTLCQNTTKTLSDSTTGGTWSSGNITVATINVTTGVVTGVSAGIAEITYAVPGGCRTTVNVTVYPVAPITGTPALCQRRDSTILADAVPGGTWSTNTPTIATVTNTGTVYGGPTMAGGVAVIKYVTPHACISTVSVTVHGTPAAPGVTPKYFCQLGPTAQLVQTSGTGPTFTWYGPGVTAGYSPGVTPLSTLAGVDTYYVTQTSTYGCASDSATQLVTVNPKPTPPTTVTVKYCQFSVPGALDLQVSNTTGTLNWYSNAGTLLPVEPAIPTTSPTYPDSLIWYVSQTITNVIGCKSDSVIVAVKIIPKPIFTIDTRGWVCQHDSISLGYVGPQLIFGGYLWTLPEGASFGQSTGATDSFVYVKFDTANMHNFVYLTANNLYGECQTTDSVDIEVVKIPSAFAYSKANVCMSDTTSLALSSRSDNSLNYVWAVDNELLVYSPVVTIISSNSNSAGPYSIRWNDTGRHIIYVQAFAAHGCADMPSPDTIQVRPLPDASFRISTHNSTLCLEDTVLFSSNDSTFANSYLWTPAHFFTENDHHAEWGRVELSQSIVTLTVTDPYGCIASSTRELDPTVCCSIPFPTAFTPNGDGLNDVFRPIPNGVYHVYHHFRVENRWGQVIFNSNDNRAEWDGTFNGVPQDLGVYFWYLEYDCNGETVQAKGDVTLVR